MGEYKWHPSYGWATDAQIERLKKCSPGSYEQKKILNEINQQTKAKGKKK